MRLEMKRPKRLLDWRGFVVFVAISGIFGYAIHRLSGLDLRWSMALAAIGILAAGLMAAFGDDP
jgi:hypothetical protein